MSTTVRTRLASKQSRAFGLGRGGGGWIVAISMANVLDEHMHPRYSPHTKASPS